MPAYTFEFEDDKSTTTVQASILRAPKLGTRKKIGGRWARRIIDRPVLKIRGDVAFTSKQAPLNWPFAPRCNAKGEPQFETAREIRESCAKAQHAGEDISYDW